MSNIAFLRQLRSKETIDYEGGLEVLCILISATILTPFFSLYIKSITITTTYSVAIVPVAKCFTYSAWILSPLKVGDFIAISQIKKLRIKIVLLVQSGFRICFSDCKASALSVYLTAQKMQSSYCDNIYMFHNATLANGVR